MERGKPYLKVAAVLSSVALVGAFVAYRAGAFDKPAPQPDPQLAAPSAGAGEPVITPSDGPERSVTLTPEELKQAIMYGSKSAPAFVPTQPSMQPNSSGSLLPPQLTPVQPAAPSGNQKPPVFMGGSKSAEIFPVPPAPFYPQPAAQQGPPKVPAPNAPVFMGGSKSLGPLFTPPMTVPTPQPPAPQPPANAPPR
jgi:hypothetical protein